MNKTLFNYCQKHLRFIDQGQLKSNVSLKSLVNQYNIGYIESGIYHFNQKDKQHLMEVIARELNGVLLSDPYPEGKSRTHIAQTNRNEKLGALKVSEDFVLLNSLHSLRLNKQETENSSLSALGHFICASEIVSIEHQQIVLVENLIVMANLSRLNIPDKLKEALWLYRGDAQAHKQTGVAYRLFRQFKHSHQLICFSDVDPSGLQICLTSGASQCLTLTDDAAFDIVLKGHEKEWFNQKNAINYLNNYVLLPAQCTYLFHRMKQTQTTLKQEHILQHSLPLALFPLSR